MNKRKMFSIHLIVFSLSIYMVNSQSILDYWGTLEKGEFNVGFKSKLVLDTTRVYDLTFGNTAILESKNTGRPIVFNIWYPTYQKEGESVMKIKDYFDFPKSEETDLFTSKLADYQYENSKIYTSDFNIRKEDFLNDPLVDIHREQVFNNYLSTKTISIKDAEVIEKDFPVIIYHQGLGGTVDENILLIEYLASHGYIIVNSAFQNSDASWTLGVGDQMATYEDFNFIINFLKETKVISRNKVFLMGHSYGANSSIGYIGEGYENVDGIIPLDSDLGYLLHFNFHASKYNFFEKDKLKYYKIPIFCAARSKAIFRLTDSLTTSRRFYLKVPELKHNDFTSQGAMGRCLAIPYLKDKKNEYRNVHKNYLKMCRIILGFLNSETKNKLIKIEAVSGKENGWEFETVKKGQKSNFNSEFQESTMNCPNISQWLDIILDREVEKSKQLYTKCTESDIQKQEALVKVAEALFYDAEIKTTLDYLGWIKEMISSKSYLPVMFHISLNAFWVGRENLKPKTILLYEWMVENFPDSKYGYMGLVLVNRDKTNELENCCKALKRKYPDYSELTGTGFWENQIVEIVNNVLQEKK